MKALRYSLHNLLAVTGSVGLALLAIPVVAVLAIALRMALFVAIPVAVIAALALGLLSPRFRRWLETSLDPEERYKGLRLARDIAVDPGHAWVKPRGTGVIVGADDLVATAIGPVDSVDLPPPGQEVRRGEIICRLTRANRSIEVAAPVSGIVVARNDALGREPTLVNADPFHRGWLLKLREAPDVDDAARPLRRGRDLTAWFRGEVDRLLTIVAGEAVPVMADGGLVEYDLHRRIDDRTWQRVTEMLRREPVMKRRNFLQLVGLTAGASLAAPAKAAADSIVRPDGNGLLIDLTACIGCRTCEATCAETNHNPAPDYDPKTVDDIQRTTSEKQFVVVNRHQTSKGDVFARRQCMHCIEPACTSACLTKALYKTDEGPIIYRENKCMGCRYCMVSCPFDVPKFEYQSAAPRIRKCQMCFARQQEGKKPACVETCPAEAITFGKRSDLLEIARKRIYTTPGKYISHIYGEKEAGGTNVLYLSAVPFAELGFPTTLGEIAYPEYSKNFLTAVPVVLTLWPAFLLALRKSTAPPPAAPDGDADVSAH